MKKAFLLFLIMFLVFPFLAYSSKTFVVQETERISLVPKVTDPDVDKLTSYYTPPLNANGEWQTNYGDAGRYSATITVSDGITNTSEDVIIIVNKKEEAPTIDAFAPKEESINIDEGASINFSVSASDLNKDTLSYEWLVDGKNAKDEQEFAYETGYKDAGSHKIEVIVSDGNMTASREWNVNVENVDVESLIDGIPNVNANANDVVKLKLPDFEKYGLDYEISEPVGNKNEWKTTYDDAGTYDVKVNAGGKEFSGYKIVKVVVNKVDRAPIFEPIPNLVMDENQEVKIPLKASDPDGDNVSFSANSMPEGANIEDDVFTWKPGYDTVTRDGFVENLINKFRIQSKNFYLQFVASSKDKNVVQNIVITVRNANRAPVIEDMQPITINEGDILTISPNAYDPDGDKISLSYSGFANSNHYKTKIGDAGNRTVRVTASDGSLESSKDVQIMILSSNAAPVFNKINDIKASENDQIAILLSAYDPNGDLIYYSIDNPPNGSSLNGNAFIWTPGYDLVSKGETKKYDLVFVASDGKLETKKIVKAEISDKNKIPRIINASSNIVARVNKPVLMYVNAVDDDGDTLTYTWKFGFFERYKATPLHQRTFRSRGTKTVKVIVSDGTDKVEQLINVNVI